MCMCTHRRCGKEIRGGTTATTTATATTAITAPIKSAVLVFTAMGVRGNAGYSEFPFILHQNRFV